MGLQYPQYNLSEYGCLNKDLGGIFSYTKYLEIRARIDMLRQQIKDITSLPPSGIALMDEIQAVMLRIMSRHYKKEDRPKVLEGLRKEFMEVLQKTSLPREEFEEAKERVVRNIMNLYFGFNMSDFEKDYHDIFFEECTNESTPKRLKALQDALAKAEKEAADSDWMKTDPANWFTIIPNKFRDRRVHDTFKKQDMGRFIIESFVADWRHRVVKFAVPVSITGVSISSMPREMSHTWLKAYKGLGFDKLELRGLYIPRPCDIRDKREAPPANANIPKVFQPSSKSGV